MQFVHNIICCFLVDITDCLTHNVYTSRSLNLFRQVIVDPFCFWNLDVFEKKHLWEHHAAWG